MYFLHFYIEITTKESELFSEALIKISYLKKFKRFYCGTMRVFVICCHSDYLVHMGGFIFPELLNPITCPTHHICSHICVLDSLRLLSFREMFLY